MEWFLKLIKLFLEQKFFEITNSNLYILYFYFQKKKKKIL
jgi:hypothetical protein